MRKILAVTLALSLLYIPLSAYAVSPVKMNAPKAIALWQDQQDQQYQDQQVQDEYGPYVPYSPEQLDNLLAPIALYPDPLLAQVLPAATFVDQIDDADRWVRANGQEDIDDQPWDVSVKAVAHYPEVLDMMDEKLDWTTAVGQAYVNQSTDVMESVQRLRSMAYSQGNLVSNSQWQIVDQDGVIQIWPASPQYIYVPTYDPTIIYARRAYFGGAFGVGISFGVGFAIGAWLNRDTDWREHRVYYTGWRGDNDWQRRSRPYIQQNNVYINNRVSNVTINRTVVNRRVNVNNVNNYTSVHRNVNFDNTARNRNVPSQNNRGNQNTGIDRNQNRQTNQNNQNNRPNTASPGYQAPPVGNRVINRNIDTSNPRLDQFRGRQTPQQQGVPQQQPQQQQQQRNRATQQVPPQPVRPAPQPVRPVPPQVNRQAPPQQVRPVPTPPQGPHAFGRTEGNFTPQAASQRGQQSRQQMNRPAPPRPEPSRAQPPKSKPNRPGKPQ